MEVLTSPKLTGLEARHTDAIRRIVGQLVQDRRIALTVEVVERRTQAAFYDQRLLRFRRGSALGPPATRVERGGLSGLFLLLPDRTLHPMRAAGIGS